MDAADPISAREQLYGRMLAVCATLDDDAAEVAINAYLDARVRADAELQQASQLAGGRWQLSHGQLVFQVW